MRGMGLTGLGDAMFGVPDRGIGMAGVGVRLGVSDLIGVGASGSPMAAILGVPGWEP